MMTWKKIFVVVTIAALFGMVMGGLFGLAAGRLAPDFFRHLIPWQDVEPVGIAILLGATAGVLLGGALGCFGLMVQTLLQWKARAPIEK
jgi:ABC-type dipeptide/oligopeptide/nickel transport system permease subunit